MLSLLRFIPKRNAFIRYKTAVAYNDAKPFDQIPGPPQVPIIGNGYFVIFNKEYRDKVHLLYVDLTKKYGGLYKINLFTLRFLVITDPEYAKTYFKNETEYPIIPSLTLILGHLRNEKKDLYPEHRGIFGSDGPEWWEVRSAANQEIMRTDSAFAYIDDLSQIADEFTDMMWDLRDRMHEMPENFHTYIHLWAMEGVGVIFLGQRLKSFSQENMSNPDSPSYILQKCVKNFVTVFLNLRSTVNIWQRFPFLSPAYREFTKSQMAANTIISDYIDKCKSELIFNKEKGINKKRGVLEKLIERCGPNSTIPKHIAFDGLFAGVDNTGNTASNTLYNIAIRPHVQKKIYEEIQQVVGDKELTPGMLNRMKYMNAVIKESMRTHPGTTGLERKTQDDMVIGGYQVPKGTTLLIGTEAMTKLHVENPLKFIPERWMRDEESGVEPVKEFSYLPFGHGRRKCVGMRIALLEIQILVIKTLQKYKISYHYEPITVKNLVVNVPILPNRLRLESRHGETKTAPAVSSLQQENNISPSVGVKGEVKNTSATST